MRFIFLCLFISGLTPLHASQMPAKVVEVSPVVLKDLRQTTRLFGLVHAMQEYTHVAEAEGVLDQTRFPGQKLAKGEIFAEIINPESKAAYELALRSEKIAHDQYQRALTLLSKQAVSQKTVENERAKWIEAQQNSLQAKTALEKVVFKAPFEGVLGVFRKREGAYIQRGDKIVTLYNPETLVVEFDIPEKFLQNLTPQHGVVVEGQTYVLNQLQKVVDPSTNMAPTYITLTKGAKLLPGSIVDVDLVLSQKNSVPVISRESLFIDSGTRYVYVVEKNEVGKRAIETGIIEGDWIEVTQGLKKGELVVDKNPTRLYEGEAVKIKRAQDTPPKKD